MGAEVILDTDDVRQGRGEDAERGEGRRGGGSSERDAGEDYYF
jgi:hypothetical protein